MGWPYAKLLENFTHLCVEKGLSGVFKPLQIKRVGFAEIEVERRKQLFQAQTEIEVDQIRKGKATAHEIISGKTEKTQKIDSKIEPDFELSDLAIVAAHIDMNERLRKDENVTKAIIHAETELRDDDSEMPESVISDDWLYRWRDYASGFSSSDMQLLWGKILAGEYKSPGSFSYFALDILKSLSTEDAQKVARIAPLVIGNFLPSLAVSYLNRSGIDLQELLYFEQLGILHGVTTILNSSYDNPEKTDTYEKLFYFKEIGLFCTHPDPTSSINIEGYLVTKAGYQILKMCEFEANHEYIRELAQEIKDKGFTVKRGFVAPNKDGTITITGLASI